MNYTPKIWNPQQPAPGLYTMTAEQYHADPCPRPSLSAGGLAILLESTPFHAWYRHPKLGAGAQEFTRKTEIGSATHRLVLDAGPEVQVIQADSYRSKDAREQQAAAEAVGRLPILTDDYAVAQAIAKPLRQATEDYLGAKIVDCLREVVIVWMDGEFWRRAMIDAMTPDLRKMLDLKTTRGSAAPHSSVQRIFDGGYHLQDAHYTRGADTIDLEGRGRRSFGYLFAEVDAPHCIGPPIELSEGARTIARDQWSVGSTLWDSCLKHDYWPSYDGETHVAECPPWVEQRWIARMNSDETLNPIQPTEATSR